MSTDHRTREELLAENERLRLRLEEAEEMLSAIQNGEVDALIVNTPQGDRIFSLEGAEQPYRVLVESINEGAATLATDGTILYCNTRLAAMLQTPLETVIGTSLISYVAPGDRGICSARLAESLDQPRADEFCLVTGCGSTIPVQISCCALILMEGKGISLVVTDLTQQKRNEEIVKEKEHMLLQQNRLAAMGEMIGNIAHQWRQPLNSLGLSIQRLPLYFKRGIFTEELLDQSIREAMVQIQHMSSTIDDFRNFFRSDKEKVDFKIIEAVAQSLKLIEASFKNCHISIDFDHQDDPTVYGYPNEYAQAVLNILSNAREVIEARNTANPRVAVRISARDGRSLVEIRDNAGGIPEDIILKVFDPHFTTKGSRGTGIGLFMAKNIIERNMNGRLSVNNTSDGAEFRIEV